jgi:urease beta subunit
MRPGEYLIEPGEIEANAGRRVAKTLAMNTGDRPIQVGSHYHFFEVNVALVFDRPTAYGMRLNIPAGTSVRFEPGESKQIALVEFGGARRVLGHNGLVAGPLDDEVIKTAALKQLQSGSVAGFKMRSHKE